MKEKEIEKYLVKRVKEVGGIAYKFVSPGNAGVPDRLVLLPGGKICFVELKASGKTTTALQRRQIEKIRNLGFEAFIFDCKLDVDVLIMAHACLKWGGAL